MEELEGRGKAGEKSPNCSFSSASLEGQTFFKIYVNLFKKIHLASQSAIQLDVQLTPSTGFSGLCSTLLTFDRCECCESFRTETKRSIVICVQRW